MQFVSPGAMAGNAFQEELMRREMLKRQQMLDQIAQQRQRTVDDQNQQELMLRAEEQRQQQERQAKIDAEREDTRQAGIRKEQNTVGVRGMMADAMTQGPLTPESAKTIGIMAFREGMQAPPEVERMLEPQEPEPDPEQFTLGEGQTRYDATGKVIARGAPRPQPQPSGGGGGTAPTQPERPDAAAEYGLMTADRTITAIDGVLPKISNWTAGAGGRVLGMFPGTDAADVSAELQTIAGNIAFNALQQMRAASKTGGALGSIAQQELQMLQSVEGSLRQSQSPENLKAQLGKVRESMERFKAAQSAQGGERPMPSHGGGSFRVVGVR